MVVALQLLTADQLQDGAKFVDVPLNTVRTRGRITVPAKWKAVLHCIREAAGVDARMVVAINDTTVGRLYRQIAWKPIMQHLVDAIYPKNNAVVQSPCPSQRPPSHNRRCSPRLNGPEAA